MKSFHAVLIVLVVVSLPAVSLEPPSGVRVPGTEMEFFLIGWSRDGKLAYAIVDEPPFRNGYGFTFAVVDVRTDAILFSHYDHSDQFGSPSGNPLAVAWERNAGIVARSVEQFGIEPLSDARVDSFPLIRGADRYRVEIAEWRVDPKASPYENGVVGYTATFHSSERGSKEIARRGRIFATDITPVGYVRSPFENRLAVLVAESGNAYGSNRFTDYTIIGAHLDAEFE